MKTYKELADEYNFANKLKEEGLNKQNKLSEEEQLKLLNTPELVELYIDKHRLSDESELKLLNTTGLVELYITDYIKNHN